MKVKQVLIKCKKCGKGQYSREDSMCATEGLCSKCMVDVINAKRVPQAPEVKAKEVTHCTCGAVTTHKCVEYDCKNCIGV